MIRFTFMLVLLFGTSFFVVAQSENFKFGKPTKEELEMKECAFYPEAGSMILSRKGYISMEYKDEEGWIYRYNIEERRKIFSVDDKDIGTVKVLLYDPKDSREGEKLMNLKAFTFNLKDGKEEKIKLDKSAQFEKQVNDLYKEVTFTFPDVQQGSVLDFKYSVTSPYYGNLRTWQYQDDIPVAYSYLSVTIPEFFGYQQNIVGNLIPLEKTEEYMAETFRSSYTVPVGMNADNNIRYGNGGGDRKYSNLSSNSKHFVYIGKDILPVEDEPYMANPDDAYARTEFQLLWIQYPQQEREVIAGNYERTNQELITSPSFGQQLKKGKFAEELVSASASLEEKVSTVYKYVINNTSWNNFSGIRSSSVGKPLFKSGEGTIADINLTLTAGLRAVEVDAHPVILSTRGHGRPHPIYPSYDDFNYVITAIRTNEGLMLLDASTGLPPNVLPTKCLNGQGWMVTPEGGQWISLKTNSLYETTNMTTLQLEGGQLKAEVKVQDKGYSAIPKNIALLREGKEELEKSVTEQNEDWKLDQFSCPDEPEDLQEIQYEFKLAQEVEEDADVLYIQPLAYGVTTENPFKRETRQSNVEFPCPESEKLLFTFIIPEGYEAELPESAAVALPNNGGLFRYNAAQSGNKITILSSFSRTQNDFSPAEYPGLKEFYRLMVEKNQQMIVLTKKS